MSKETAEWLNNKILIGYTSKRGNAWWYRADLQGERPNHYEHEVPVEDVRTRLFDWEPEEAEVKIVLPNGAEFVDTTRKAIVHPVTKHVFNIPKVGWKNHGFNERLIGFVADLLDNDDLKIGSAGLLKKDAVAWVQFEMEENLEVRGMQVRPFLTAMTSLDGSLATDYKVGSQVVVCDNTLDLAAREAGPRFRVAHTKYSFDNIVLGDVREKLGLVLAQRDGIMAEIERLSDIKVTPREWDAFLGLVAPIGEDTSTRGVTMAERKRDELHTLWTADERVAPWTGTGLGVLQAMNTYEQHFARVGGGAERWERNTLNFLRGKTRRNDNATLRNLTKALQMA